MASSGVNYHRRGPYFDGTNFASWKHKMKMHILGYSHSVWDVIRVGVQGDFFGEGREPDHDAIAEELKMLQFNAQASDIIFIYLCPKELIKINHLENAK